MRQSSWVWNEGVKLLLIVSFDVFMMLSVVGFRSVDLRLGLVSDFAHKISFNCLHQSME